MAKRKTSIGEKVEYVRKQGQTRDHHCHWPGCTKQVPPALWGCRGHWYRLPQRLRNKIWAAYRPGQEKTMTPSKEYLAAAREVQEWIRDNYPPKAESESKQPRKASESGTRSTSSRKRSR